MKKFNEIPRPENIEVLNLILKIKGIKEYIMSDDWNFIVLEYHPEILKLPIRRIIKDARKLPFYVLQGEVKFFEYNINSDIRLVVFVERSLFSTIEIFAKLYENQQIQK